VRLDGRGIGQPAVPARLLVSPFDHVATYDYERGVILANLRVDRWSNGFSMAMVYGLGIPCFPFSESLIPHICPWMSCSKRQEYVDLENKIETIYSRRVAITKKGVLFKTLKTHPVGVRDQCCGKAERFPEFERNEYKQFISFDLIDDERLRVVPPVGGYRRKKCCWDTGYIPHVESRVQGCRMMVNGLVAPNAFVETILAVKHGQPMPPIDRDGILDFSAGIPAPDDATIAPHVSRNVHEAYASKQQGIRTQISPKTIEMSRVGGNSECVPLLAEISRKLDVQNGKLDVQNELLQRIAQK
jgi:hypothetical protein